MLEASGVIVVVKHQVFQPGIHSGKRTFQHEADLCEFIRYKRVGFGRLQRILRQKFMKEAMLLSLPPQRMEEASQQYTTFEEQFLSI